MVVSPLFYFTKEENKILKPLQKAYEKGIAWAESYQAVKHDRFSFLYKGNVKALIGALAALYLLNIYYKNYSLELKLQDISSFNFSFGSLVFAIKEPVIPEKFIENEFVFSESPFVIKCKNEFANKISLQLCMIANLDLECQISTEEENKGKDKK